MRNIHQDVRTVERVKVTVRLPRSLQNRLAKLAEGEMQSLNDWMVDPLDIPIPAIRPFWERTRVPSFRT